MSYQDRIDIDRLYDLIYDAQSEQLRVVTREEFEQLFGSISSFKDMQDLYYDKSEVDVIASDLTYLIVNSVSNTFSIVWDDNDDVDGIRPLHLRWDIKDSTNRTTTLLLYPTNNWSDTFNLLKDDYSNSFPSVYGYTKNVTKTGTNYVATYTHTPKTIDVDVKFISDSSDLASLTFDFMQDDVVYDTVTLNNYEVYSFTDLPEYKSKGVPYRYYPECEPIAGYRIDIVGSTEQGFEIRASQRVGELTAEITTLFLDEEGYPVTEDDGALEFELTRDGHHVDTITLQDCISGRYEFGEMIEGTYEFACTNANTLFPDYTLGSESVISLPVTINSGGSSTVALFLQYEKQTM